MKKKTKNIIYIVWSIALVSIVLFTYRYRIIEFINDHFIGEQELGDFTMEQKVEDFEIFYSNIVESVPYLDDVYELYGIDFKGRYEYYLEQIKNTKSNIEFYGVLQAISQDVGSFHTDIAFPWYENLKGLGCYNLKKTLYQLGMEPKLEAWWDEFEDELKKYEDIPYINVTYMDGKYIVSNYSVARGWKV
ncbi:MAG: hypothetical protein IJA32_05930 [Lachnospiraceae bacterium]|nr:hypothetical protein [Lachnospiraceae bacterium]